ncbi:hypothetical protein HWE04_24185, partial [Herbaspirillum sp. C7C2]|uniref:calcium-binding protein n=1 Tax=Herbaspirillum sp. C7C2 TaxID=2736666 RepID=UPI00406BF33E|nr:hypothetical protein [Herbaspirillum sp. C7C2]
ENENWTGFFDQSNRMVGLAGNDALHGGQLADTIDGGDGNDGLSGNGGDDTLIGGNGNDWLSGDNGNDTLIGGNGNDWIHGGHGNDTYRFNRGDGVDIINDCDYTAGNIDTIRLGKGIKAADTVLTRSGDHLTLTWG